MLAFTNRARQSNIDEITRLIDKLGKMPSENLSYLTYRALVDYLSILRDEYRKEMENN